MDRSRAHGRAFRFNGAIDPVIPVKLAPRVVDLYLAGADPRNPDASPLYGDPTGLPPTLILVAANDALRIAGQMRAAGCHAAIEVWPHIWHDWPMYMRVMREAKAAIARVAKFMQDKL